MWCRNQWFLWSLVDDKIHRCNQHSESTKEEHRANNNRWNNRWWWLNWSSDDRSPFLRLFSTLSFDRRDRQYACSNRITTKKEWSREPNRPQSSRTGSISNCQKLTNEAKRNSNSSRFHSTKRTGTKERFHNGRKQAKQWTDSQRSTNDRSIENSSEQLNDFEDLYCKKEI